MSAKNLFKPTPDFRLFMYSSQACMKMVSLKNCSLYGTLHDTFWVGGVYEVAWFSYVCTLPENTATTRITLFCS